MRPCAASAARPVAGVPSTSNDHRRPEFKITLAFLTKVTCGPPYSPRVSMLTSAWINARNFRRLLEGRGFSPAVYGRSVGRAFRPRSQAASGAKAP
ncbi:hypothetical protein SBA2_280002 [Acidobacteriia bacterium SbA2]|nr:hypothetical protein SBA2_280002 [Acidobacteriia bacterium SbA2]